MAWARAGRVPPRQSPSSLSAGSHAQSRRSSRHGRDSSVASCAAQHRSEGDEGPPRAEAKSRSRQRAGMPSCALIFFSEFVLGDFVQFRVALAQRRVTVDTVTGFRQVLPWYPWPHGPKPACPHARMAPWPDAPASSCPRPTLEHADPRPPAGNSWYAILVMLGVDGARYEGTGRAGPVARDGAPAAQGPGRRPVRRDPAGHPAP